MREIEQIRELGADHQATALLQTWNRKIKTQNKDTYIMFYKTEVIVALDDVVNEHPLLGKYLFKYTLPSYSESSTSFRLVSYEAIIYRATVMLFGPHRLSFYIFPRILGGFLNCGYATDSIIKF